MNQRHQAITELQGKPGQGVGNMVIPINGTTSMQLQEELIYIQTKLAYNLESSESYIRLCHIDSIVLAQGRNWWLLWLGIPLIVFFIGIILIILFFVIKQRWIAIHSGRMTHILFFQNSELNRAKQFTHTLLALTKRSAAPRLQDKPLNAAKPRASNRNERLQKTSE
ncbi:MULTISPECIES: hypothetical protein [Spirulina sp. CCY15215]|uniref:hypothetical protein n=1 Tax=Spirulina sp. CCY15215 TaxID=2767591 RepID=UPI00194E8C11|nr:hypothetical protein [Spirulina major]